MWATISHCRLSKHFALARAKCSRFREAQCYSNGDLSHLWKQANQEADLDRPEWQPVPLELPLDDPYRRPPAPAGGIEVPAPDSDAPHGRVIVIDLA